MRQTHVVRKAPVFCHVRNDKDVFWPCLLLSAEHSVCTETCIEIWQHTNRVLWCRVAFWVKASLGGHDRVIAMHNCCFRQLSADEQWRESCTAPCSRVMICVSKPEGKWLAAA